MDNEPREVPDSFTALPMVGTDVRSVIDRSITGQVSGHTFTHSRGVMYPCLVVQLDKGQHIGGMFVTVLVMDPSAVEVRPWGDTVNTKNADYWLAVARHERMLEMT